MRTYGDLFTGFGGATIGAMQAGLSPLWGVEHDPDIAAVARRNLDHPIVEANVLDCDPHDFGRVGVLHASPPCPNFSVAKAGAKETEQDIALGRKVAEFITAIVPPVFTLENVYMYRKSESFQLILRALRNGGYHFRYWHLNAASYGVPQTRKRLILVAARDFIPQRPPATHAPPDEIAPLFDRRRPWVGWYEAIEDLIPGLPDSEFAPWQLERLPDELKSMLLSQGISRNHHNEDYGKATNRRSPEPAFSVTANHNQAGIRAFVLSNAATEWSDGRRNGDDPMLAVSGQTGGRAYAGGRTVVMTPRALARFQTIPDWYELPNSKTLTCRGIGNAVPPLLYRRVLEALL